MFRPCDECNACCSGQLIGDIYGFEMGCGKPCSFLLKGKCTIYDDRPEVCRNYQCAWSQGLFTIDMRPDKIGLMVSVEKGINASQYLKIIQVHKNISPENLIELEEQIKQLNVHSVYIPFQDGNDNAKK